MAALHLYMPTRLIDLTSDQLVYVSRLFLMGYSETEFRVKAFIYLSGMQLKGRLFVHKSVKQPFEMDEELLAELSHRCDFLLKTDEVKPIRRIGMNISCHCRLYDASFERYLMAENYYFAYVETKEQIHLDNLISCLYLRPWEKFDAALIQKRAKRYKDTDMAIKYAVFMWYIGFRSYVPKRCKKLFTSSGGSSGVFNVRNYINGMVHQLNNGDITIKDKLMQQPCWDALDELEQRAIEADRGIEK